jgi:predicted aminopeptidase
MRARKAQMFAALGDEIKALEKRQGVKSSGYDQWIKEGLNNARLASEANYYDCVPGFERLLAEQGNDLPRFYAAAKELSRLPMAERHEKLCKSPVTVTLQQPEPAVAAGAKAP